MRWCNQCRSFQETEERRIIDWGEQVDNGYEELCRNCGEAVYRVVYIKLTCDGCGNQFEFPVFLPEEAKRMTFTQFCDCGKSTDYDISKITI
jgi:hypothetical protein